VPGLKRKNLTLKTSNLTQKKMIIIKVEVNVGLPLTEDEETNTLNNMKVE
jgi:hypothetical protein